jgi:epoxyqueuosine reductase QueG
MQQFKKGIQQAAGAASVDLIGFAGRERFEDLADDINPFSLFPEAQTAIMIARRITRGTLRGVEEGINFVDYGMFGRSWLSEEFVSRAAYDLAAYIERAGYEAMPVMPGTQNAVSGVARDVNPDFKYAAVACGLGEIGMGGEVLTPRFGPRQRFAIILTDAKLPQDPLLDKPICTHCGRCIGICPLNALDGGNIEEIEICGKKMSVARLDVSKCAICKNGAIKGDDGVDRLAALCTRTCVDELEKSKAVENIFEQGFRKRRAWGKDEFGDNVEIDEGGLK